MNRLQTCAASCDIIMNAEQAKTTSGTDGPEHISCDCVTAPEGLTQHCYFSLNIPKTFGYSHYSPGAIPNNLDAEWVLDNSDPVKPIALFSLRSCRNRQLHWYLIAIIIWVIDLHVEELLLHQFMHITHESIIAPLCEQKK